MVLPHGRQAVRTFADWSPQNGAGRDPCCAFAVTLEIAPGATEELQFVLGQAEDAEAARRLVTKYRTIDADAVLANVKASWNRLLDTVQIRTPDRAWICCSIAGCCTRRSAAACGDVPRSIRPAVPTASATSCRIAWP